MTHSHTEMCSHPSDLVQSGIYALGVWVPPVCMVCGAELLTDIEVEALTDEPVSPQS